MNRFRLTCSTAAVTLAALCTAVLAPGPDVGATPHPGQSQNVVIIGGPVIINGGTLPTSGLPGELGDFTFTSMSPALVSAASLTPFDTAVLNVASAGMGCNAGTLTAQQKTDLVAFVGAGKKLIIFDSECPPQDYSWMPFPFATSNPGAQGARGTLTIVEENLLSSNNPADPHFIDAADLSTNTDAVGDMNVMTTFDPNWCVDMSGTNVLNVTGPVHTYAKYPAGTDRGLFIYNGLDQDLVNINSNLSKIWVQELQHPFNPSNLPCGITVVGITLEPPSATNAVGQSHTVTATLKDLLGVPQSGILVTVRVLAGPNVGASGSCTANSNCTTDANGQVSFTYAGTGGVGTDSLIACFTDRPGSIVCSQKVTKTWEQRNHKPDCDRAAPSITELWPPNHQMVPVSFVGVTDPDGDPITVTVIGVTQDEPLNTLGDGNTCPDAIITPGGVQLRAERTGTPKVPGNGRVYTVTFTATDSNGGSCTHSVNVCVPHDRKPGRVCVDDGQNYSSTGSCGPPARGRVGDLNVTFAGLRSPTATFEYSLTRNGQVELSVYDVAGRRLVSIVDGQQGAGAHAASWNTLGLPSGIYLARLRTSEYTVTRKFIVQK